MPTAGIIAEYNPFHLGHAALIDRLKQNGATHIVVVMSGNFVQRGDAAVISKWARTKQALLCGADLVVELPLPWSVAGAEKFALGGVFILNALKADIIGFGSECGNIEQLKGASNALLSPLLHDKILTLLSGGATFAAARQSAVKELFGESTADLLREPNNILGIEYLKAITRLNSPMEPFTVKRLGTAHNSSNGRCAFPSSAQIRSMLKNNKDCSIFMPGPAWAVLKAEIEAGRAPASLSYIERGILAKLRIMDKHEFKVLPDISEGLENRVYSAVRKAKTLDELYALIKTKRYPHARIRRIVLSAFLGLNSSLTSKTPPYIRVLGMNDGGKEILRNAKSGLNLPVITRSSDIKLLDSRAKNIMGIEDKAADLFALCLPKAGPCGLDKTTGLIIT